MSEGGFLRNDITRRAMKFAERLPAQIVFGASASAAVNPPAIGEPLVSGWTERLGKEASIETTVQDLARGIDAQCWNAFGKIARSVDQFIDLEDIEPGPMRFLAGCPLLIRRLFRGAGVSLLTSPLVMAPTRGVYLVERQAIGFRAFLPSSPSPDAIKVESPFPIIATYEPQTISIHYQVAFRVCINPDGIWRINRPLEPGAFV